MPTTQLDPVTGLLKKSGSQSTTQQFGEIPVNSNTPGGAAIAAALGLSGGSDPLTGTTATIPGFTPDYASLIANDPNLLQLQKDLGAAGTADLAGRNAAINRALVGFGQVPDLNAASSALGLDVSGLIDPTTAGLASQNQFSTEANLGRANSQAIRTIQQQLAARGGLQSGELGYQLKQQQTAYGQAQNDATQSLLDALGQYQQGYVQGQQQRQQQLDAGYQTAAQTQAQLNPPTGSMNATYDQGASGQWGKPVYRGTDGNLYNADGSPVTGNPPGGSTPNSGSYTPTSFLTGAQALAAGGPYSWGAAGKQ